MVASRFLVAAWDCWSRTNAFVLSSSSFVIRASIWNGVKLSGFSSTFSIAFFNSFRFFFKSVVLSSISFSSFSAYFACASNFLRWLYSSGSSTPSFDLVYAISPFKSCNRLEDSKFCFSKSETTSLSASICSFASFIFFNFSFLSIFSVWSLISSTRLSNGEIYFSWASIYFAKSTILSLIPSTSAVSTTRSFNSFSGWIWSISLSLSFVKWPFAASSSAFNYWATSFLSVTSWMKARLSCWAKDGFSRGETCEIPFSTALTSSSYWFSCSSSSFTKASF